MRSVVWDKALLAYDLGETHPFNPVRLALTIKLATELGVLEDVELLVPGAAGEDELLRVHAKGYLDAVRDAPGLGADLAHGLGTDDNPVFPDMHEASSLVVGGTLLAAKQIASGAAERAVNIAGGLHHAMPDRASGFCVYNDCAIAISWLLDNGFDRIAYLDTDVHHGDGVQAAFYGDPRVLTISLHQHPRTLWPGTGYARELGAGKGNGYAVNLPLPPGTQDPAWLRAWHAVVPSLLEQFEPQLIVSQCGVDSHAEDPLADLSLSVDGHAAIYRNVRELARRYAGGKWLAIGGGGYQLVRVVPRSWTHLLATVLDRDIPGDTAIPEGWRDFVGGLAPRIELPKAMSDRTDTDFLAWGGDVSDPTDASILATRRAVFPLHGLEPDDPRD
ncbi:acetoin utilization protein AcuC [Sciscionella marina]|uniref:acetoin utilization protein AcuC n=1 Tax=Sciscionella marina TaxID=508770 RepID=UPI0004764694|nr:acetoin utilization protein AcuC [Sciscionella marina]